MLTSPLSLSVYIHMQMAAAAPAAPPATNPNAVLHMTLCRRSDALSFGKVRVVINAPQHQSHIEPCVDEIKATGCAFVLATPAHLVRVSESSAINLDLRKMPFAPLVKTTVAQLGGALVSSPFVCITKTNTQEDRMLIGKAYGEMKALLADRITAANMTVVFVRECLPEKMFTETKTPALSVSLNKEAAWPRDAKSGTDVYKLAKAFAIPVTVLLDGSGPLTLDLCGFMYCDKTPDGNGLVDPDIRGSKPNFHVLTSAPTEQNITITQTRIRLRCEAEKAYVAELKAATAATPAAPAVAPPKVVAAPVVAASPVKPPQPTAAAAASKTRTSSSDDTSAAAPAAKRQKVVGDEKDDTRLTTALQRIKDLEAESANASAELARTRADHTRALSTEKKRLEDLLTERDEQISMARSSDALLLNMVGLVANYLSHSQNMQKPPLEEQHWRIVPALSQLPVLLQRAVNAFEARESAWKRNLALVAEHYEEAGTKGDASPRVPPKAEPFPDDEKTTRDVQCHLDKASRKVANNAEEAKRAIDKSPVDGFGEMLAKLRKGIVGDLTSVITKQYAAAAAAASAASAVPSTAAAAASAAPAMDLTLFATRNAPPARPFAASANK